jgi:hypothetical protein
VKKAVFLDRDGVLNAAVVRDGKPYPPASADAMEILPGERDATDRLHAVGFVRWTMAPAFSILGMAQAPRPTSPIGGVFTASAMISIPQ